jgi:hypothetical protein
MCMKSAAEWDCGKKEQRSCLIKWKMYEKIYFTFSDILPSWWYAPMLQWLFPGSIFFTPLLAFFLFYIRSHIYLTSVFALAYIHITLAFPWHLITAWWWLLWHQCVGRLRIRTSNEASWESTSTPKEIIIKIIGMKKKM